MRIACVVWLAMVGDTTGQQPPPQHQLRFVISLLYPERK
jgi:hypothetical protein